MIDDLPISESCKPRLMPATQRYAQDLSENRRITVSATDAKAAKKAIRNIARECFPGAELEGGIYEPK